MGLRQIWQVLLGATSKIRVHFGARLAKLKGNDRLRGSAQGLLRIIHESTNKEVRQLRYNAELNRDFLPRVLPPEIALTGMRGYVMNRYTSDQNSVASQCWVEHKVLSHIKDALRVTLDWKVPSVGVLRKLTSVRFTLQSFQRHLERIMSLEEDGGYMIVVEEFKPNLTKQADALRSEHDEFRASLERLVPSLDKISPEDERRFHQVCHEINALLDQVDKHDSKEVTLLQDALLMDEGGEG